MSNSIDAIAKKYGKTILRPAVELIDKPKAIFSISPAIDFALRGGVPEGSWVSLAGPPGCGKSTTGLQLIANALQEKYFINGNRRKAFYIDVEHRLKKMNLQGIWNLKPEWIEHISSTKEHQLTAEEILDIARLIIKDPNNEGCLLVIDSTSAMCSAQEMTGDISGSYRSDIPKILANFIRTMTGVVNTMNATIVLIQHLITNTSGYGEKWMVDGGEKIKYQADVKLITKNKPPKWEEHDSHIGQMIEWEVIKSACGQSGLKATSYLRYGYGLDSLKESISLAVEFNIVKKSGAWFSFNYGEGDQKLQGEDKLYSFVKSNPKAYEFILNSLRGMM